KVVQVLRSQINDPLVTLANRAADFADFHLWALQLQNKDLDIIEAARDVLRETSVKGGPGFVAAQSRQDKSDVMLWLDDMKWDLFAIDDLKTRRPLPTDAEWTKRWAPIVVRTFATIGERPFDEKDLGQHDSLRSIPEVLGLAAHQGTMEHSDLSYRL